MHPDCETMIADIVRWIGRPYTLQIWFDPDVKRYCVGVLGETWSNFDLEWCLCAAWSYCDHNRKPPSRCKTCSLSAECIYTSGGDDYCKDWTPL
jgi:hypothetical protein